MNLCSLLRLFPLLGLLLCWSPTARADASSLTNSAEEETEGETEDETEEEAEELPPWATSEEAESESKEDSSEDQPAAATEAAEGSAEASPAKEPEEQQGQAPSTAKQVTASPTSDSWKGGGKSGLGVLIGTDNGASLKLWPNRENGISIYLAAPARLNAVSIGVGYQRHLAAVQVPGSGVQLHPYLGPSFRLRVFVYDNGAYVDGQLGANLGMSMTVRGVPAELYFQVVPGFTFGVNIPGVGLGFDVGGHVGARFYFGS
ncbi:MAG: hypothetical protein CMP23_03230 [Rickettsiales bacterium]|nr:hypothetical protein [Rickettsiales bacterium]|tara:strand:- start:2815 stop:3594 length:780 start_codon:yes stop_codon:yes gene_type:complete